MKRVAFAILLAVVMLFPSSVRAATSLDALLQQAKVSGTKVEGGMTRVFAELDGEATPLLLEEEKIGDGTYKLVNIWVLIVAPPKAFVPPAAMLKKMAELNDVLRGGAIALEGNVVLYKSSMLLNSASPDELNVRMILAHLDSRDIKKALKPFVEE